MLYIFERGGEVVAFVYQCCTAVSYPMLSLEYVQLKLHSWRRVPLAADTSSSIYQQHIHIKAIIVLRIIQYIYY